MKRREIPARTTTISLASSSLALFSDKNAPAENFNPRAPHYSVPVKQDVPVANNSHIVVNLKNKFPPCIIESSFLNMLKTSTS